MAAGASAAAEGQASDWSAPTYEGETITGIQCKRLIPTGPVGEGSTITDGGTETYSKDDVAGKTDDHTAQRHSFEVDQSGQSEDADATQTVDSL